jgi:hypothetical protein
MRSAEKSEYEYQSIRVSFRQDGWTSFVVVEATHRPAGELVPYRIDAIASPPNCPG